MAAAEATAPPPAPEEKSGGRKRVLVLAIVAVIIIAALGIGAVILLARPGPPPSGPSLNLVSVAVAGGVTTLDQSGTASLSAKAFDTNSKDITQNVSFTWSATPSTAIAITHPGVTSSAVITAVQGGSVTISATATWQGVSKSGSVSITINPLHFYVTASYYHPTVGTPVLLTVRAARADNSTATTFAGLVHFTSTDPAATLPPDSLFTSADNGVKSFTNVTIMATGSVQVTATNTTDSITGSTTIYGNSPPVASFTATASSSNPRQANFDASATTDSDGDALSYAWSFGDGNSTTTSTPATSWTYAAAGTYTVTLTVYDAWGASNQTSKTFTAHVPPTAWFSVVSQTLTSTAIQVEYTAAASTGGDGTITSYAWQFGDASSATTSSVYEFHNYSKLLDGASVTVNLTVTNSFSFTSPVSRVVPVSSTPLPPVASFTLVINNYTRTVSVDGSQSFSWTGQPISWYNWNWGDGSAILNTSSATATHSYTADGAYTITLTAVSSANLKGSTSRPAPVSQVAVPPVAIFTVTRSFMNASVDASPTFDPNGNLAWLTWNWGDGSPLQTYPSSQVTATHRYIVPGAYQITLTANDTTNLKGSTTRTVTVSNATLDYTYSDFFNVPYGEWWDMRTSIYGDLPPNANCFNATSIKDGRCSPPKTSTLPNSVTYPYTNWYPAPFGSLFWQQPGNDPFLYAPYRVGVVGQEVYGYNLSQPVFLPVMNYGAAPGKLLQFGWNMQYLDVANATALTNAGCSGVSPKSDDGFMIRSKVYLTMDWQEARRILGVPASDTTISSIQGYFSNSASPGYINPACATTSTLETTFANNLANEGNGKYDIWNSYQFPYTPLYTNFSTPIVTSTTVSLAIDMAAWGTEALMSRWFYWGNASYQTNVLNSQAAKGWWGMELAWFEDFHFNGNLDTRGMNFTLRTVLQYHFEMGTLPGPDKCLRTQTTCTEVSPSDDVPYWTWGPILSDYVSTSSKHPTSELSRWSGLQYIHSTPGANNYGQLGAYDYAPDSWPARAGEAWHFVFPAKVMFYNSSSAPIPSNPQGSLPYWNFARSGVNYVEYNTTPAGYGIYNNTLWTWDVSGNGAWGSYPAGWPTGGGAGRYPNIPWGAIILVPAGVRVVALASPSVVTAMAAPTLSGGTTSSRTWSGSLTVALSPIVAWSLLLVADPGRLRSTRERSL